MFTNFLKINRSNGLCQFQIEYMLTSTKRLIILQRIKNLFCNGVGFRILNYQEKVRSDRKNFYVMNPACSSDVRILSNGFLGSGLSASTMYNTLLKNAELMFCPVIKPKFEVSGPSTPKRQKRDDEDHNDVRQHNDQNQEDKQQVEAPLKENAVDHGAREENAVDHGPPKEKAADNGPLKEEAIEHGPPRENAVDQGQPNEKAPDNAPPNESLRKEPSKDDETKDRLHTNEPSIDGPPSDQDPPNHDHLKDKHTDEGNGGFFGLLEE